MEFLNVNRQKQLKDSNKSIPKKAKITLLDNKVLVSNFWDAKGIIIIEYLEKGKSTNDEFYTNSLQLLKNEVKRGHMVLDYNGVAWCQLWGFSRGV
ncbi:hypothetical protein CEXT_189131 [Caerostris extrusa]|uniref:Uncharacterized protein n=1 Tax=Caerostris extrusa TaxID=172846 RepID=A0AAV4MU39_CAEEX|nr:hypothetical protein CEXT_189131 [Caerostris extrusa]